MQGRRVRWLAQLVPGTAALVLGLLAASRAGAQPPLPLGGEFQVNTHTLNRQSQPDIATESNGDFVVVWQSEYESAGDDLNNWSVQGQRYASDGTPKGAQFQVNTYTTNAQQSSFVASDAEGNFIVVWSSLGSFGTDTDDNSIQGQRYDSDGSPQGAQFQVNTYTTGFIFFFSVAADADGDFIVAWNSPGGFGNDPGGSVEAQRYSSDGSALGGQFQVNTLTLTNQFAPSVAMDPEGDFIVVWATGNGLDIRGKRYASTGSALGAEFLVNSYTTGHQSYPDVAAAADGDFVVVWNGGAYSGGTNPLRGQIRGQLYASNGVKQGGEFQINSYTADEPNLRPSVAAAPGGEFLVVWDSLVTLFTDSSGKSIHGQLYASDGSPRRGPFQVNSYATGDQKDPAATAHAGGRFTVVWGSGGSFPTDTGDSVEGQRFSWPPVVPAMSRAVSFAVVAALLLLGAVHAARRRAE